MPAWKCDYCGSNVFTQDNGTLALADRQKESIAVHCEICKQCGHIRLFSKDIIAQDIKKVQEKHS
ncbi:MAG: hypothetical protein ACOX2N_04435 [Peptococcia bacterium]|jgi:predicted nucleic-acid-binding Zn-ribbon protein